MTDGCAAQIASGALRPGSWNSVLGTTLVLKGASVTPVHDATGVVYNHRAPDGSWLPGGASSVGAGVLTAAFAGADPATMDARAAAHEPSGAVAYPLVSPGERFPFLAPDASALVMGEPAGDADLWAALLQGVAFAERLCLDYLDHLGAPLDGPLTFTGGGARSPYWNQLRADILGRPARVPKQTEPALGMAALAAHGTGSGPLTDVAERMVRIGSVLEPRPGRTALFAEPYARLVDELTARGWLPPPVAAHAHTRLTWILRRHEYDPSAGPARADRLARREPLRGGERRGAHRHGPRPGRGARPLGRRPSRRRDLDVHRAPGRSPRPTPPAGPSASPRTANPTCGNATSG